MTMENINPEHLSRYQIKTRVYYNWILYYSHSYYDFSSSQVSYRFHLAHATLRHELEQKQTVFVSQPESHRVIRIKNVLDKKRFMSEGSLDSVNAVESNWEPFIGNGQRCLPGESDNCGDGGKAKDARLSYPKGL